MMDTTGNAGDDRLTAGAMNLVRAVRESWGQKSCLGTYHWLLGLMTRHGAMAEDLASGVVAEDLKKSLEKQVREGAMGSPLDVETVVTRAVEISASRGKNQANERDVAKAILTAAGYSLKQPAESPGTGSSVKSPEPVPDSDANPVKTASQEYRASLRAKRLTPSLDKYGWDLTQAAIDGKLNPVVGRDTEIELIIQTLCRRTKRNPVLIGPAGVGKTAIVEGLAQRIVRGDVPDLLKGTRIVALPISSLVADTGIVGKLEERMKAIVDDASQDGIILFIDEFHMVIGAGAASVHASGDIANILKPALARGDLAVLAATTDDEYRQYIEPDKAFERRFNPILVQELTPDESFRVLQTLRDNPPADRRISVDDQVLTWLIKFAADYLRNRFFPDKAVDVFDQCVAYAIAHQKGDLALSDAQKVASGMVGMPTDIGERLNALKRLLEERALLDQHDIQELLDRLNLTARGLDIRRSRPNAVVLLAGDAAAEEEVIAETIAMALFGGAERVVTIDFSRFVNEYDITLLVGAPPGYIGYSDTVPIHRVAQMPLCVVRLLNVDACHPHIRTFLTQMLRSGVAVDGRGKKVYFSDTVVLMTVGLQVQTRHAIGFREALEQQAQRVRDVRTGLQTDLGEAFLEQVDLIWTARPASEEARRRALQQELTAAFAERWRHCGVDVEIDGSVLDWLLAQDAANHDRNGWESRVEHEIAPALLHYIENRPGDGISLVVEYKNGEVCISPKPKGE